MAAKLILLGGDHPVEHPLSSFNTLGRHPDNSIQVLDRIVSKEHSRITLGPDGRYLKPGDPDLSAMQVRLASVGNGAAMPPLAKNVVDQQAVDLLQEYLESLPASEFELTPSPQARYIMLEAYSEVHGYDFTSVAEFSVLDGNGLPLDANGNIQFNELRDSLATPTFGRNVLTTRYDPEVLDGWFKRGYNWETSVAVQHLLFGRTSVQGGYFRRSFGNQTFTDDLRYTLADYDGPFCITAPSNSNLPDGGGYQVCGLYDLKPSVFAERRPANSLIRFTDDFGHQFSHLIVIYRVIT